jgi:Zn-dependent protease with chaperone function
MWLTWLTISASIPLILAWIIVPFWGRSAYSFIPLILITLFLAILVSSASRDEEERADSFAIVEAKISIETFARSLTKLWKSNKLQTLPETRCGYLFRIIVYKLIFNTHPSVEYRVLRLHVLYQDDEG